MYPRGVIHRSMGFTVFSVRTFIRVFRAVQDIDELGSEIAIYWLKLHLLGMDPHPLEVPPESQSCSVDHVSGSKLSPGTKSDVTAYWGLKTTSEYGVTMDTEPRGILPSNGKTT